jgi:hypothetical protein
VAGPILYSRQDGIPRKVLVGTAILARFEQGDVDERQLKRWLD